MVGKRRKVCVEIFREMYLVKVPSESLTPDLDWEWSTSEVVDDRMYEVAAVR